MRTPLLLVLFIVVTTSYSQDVSQILADSLSKYSYLIQAKTANGKMQATGFFARYQQRLFFVTAAHCVTGWDPFRFERVEDFPDTLLIRMSNDTSKLRYFTVPLADIRRTVKPFREYESPDVYVMEIRNPKAYNVYSVEHYFTEQVRCDKAKSIWVYGYPQQQGFTDYLADRQLPSPSSAALGEAYCLYPFRPEAKGPDQLNYVAGLTEEKSAAGLSGAPAYLLTEDKQIVFGGIYIGGAQKTLRSGMVVRPEWVMNKIISQIERR